MGGYAYDSIAPLAAAITMVDTEYISKTAGGNDWSGEGGRGRTCCAIHAPRSIQKIYIYLVVPRAPYSPISHRAEMLDPGEKHFIV